MIYKHWKNISFLLSILVKVVFGGDIDLFALTNSNKYVPCESQINLPDQFIHKNITGKEVHNVAKKIFNFKLS